jgi:hypothetical protein
MNSFQRPIIGVFVFKELINRLLNQKKNRKESMLQKANRKAKTTLYYFSSDSIDYNNQQINGVYYNETTNLWETKSFPYPDIIYGRRRYSVRTFRNNKQIKRIKCVNSPHYFNKWDVYTKLMKNDQIRPHLPFTKLYKHPDDLNNMFSDVNKVYLKSLKQNNGIGILCVEKLKTDNHYKYSYVKKGKLVANKVNSFSQLLNVIMSFFKSRKFVIQHAIDLLSIDGNISDIRSDVQRNGKGELEFVAHSIRVASRNSPISNTKSKPKIYQFKNFFKNKLQYSDEQVRSLRLRIENLLKIIYEELELSYGHFGEMGIDIGIDSKGKIWFIESNAKPGKNSFWVYDEKVIFKAFLNPLEYSKYLYKNS